MTSIDSAAEFGPRGMSRRRFLGTGMAAAAGVLGLSGCGSAVSAGITGGGLGKKTIDYWNLFGGGDGVRMQAMVAGYQKTHPSLDVRATTFAWGNPYYTKLSLATLGNKGPDVAVAHLTRAKTLISADLLQELHQDDLGRHGLTPDKFNQRAWKAGLVDGKPYAIPLDTHPFVTFYNTDVCKKAGLLDSDGRLKPLEGEDAFNEAMQRAKKVTGEYGGVVAIVNETSTPWRMYQSLYSQLGGEMLADDGTKVVIDHDKAMKVLTFMQNLTAKNLFPKQIDYQGAIAQMANGKAGFYFQGEWEISTFQTAKTPFSMTLFPRVFTEAPYACQADSHTLVLPKWPGHDQARIDRALGFIRSMLDQSKTWAEGGHIPAWLPFRDSATYKDMKPQSYYAAAADAAVYDAPGWYSGSGSNFEIITGSIIGAVLAGQLKPDAAINQMRSKLTALANTPSPIL